MPTISLILESHYTTNTVDFLIHPMNKSYSEQAVLAFEDTPHADMQLKGLVPMEFNFLSQRLKHYTCVKVETNNKQDAPVAFYSAFLYHPLIYAIDTAYQNNFHKEGMEEVKKRQTHWQFTSFIPREAEPYYDKIKWSRESRMAENLKEIRAIHPEKNVVAVLGANHFTVVYHLLALLSDAELTNTKINIIMPNPEISFEDWDRNNVQVFRRDGYPVKFFKGPPEALPSLHDLSAQSDMRLILPDRLMRFRQNYQLYKNQIQRMDTIFCNLVFVAILHKSNPVFLKAEEAFFRERLPKRPEPLLGSEFFEPPYRMGLPIIDCTPHALQLDIQAKIRAREQAQIRAREQAEPWAANCSVM